MRTPLEQLTVLDFSHALAGPYCAMLLASYGARVIKIEGVESGDMGRTWGPPFQAGEASYFLGLNSGKKAAAINLKDPRGIGLCHDMMKRADVVIENFRPGLMERLGLGYETARGLNPRLIYCSISGHGQTGPARDDSAMDLIMQASSGLISMTGTPEGGLARCGHSVADITAGMFGMIGILMALHARETTGQGQWVDVSMLDSMISAMASNFAYFFGSGVIPSPMGTAFATIVPYACFPARDREIAIAAANEKLWAAFCGAVGRPELAVDARFASNALRVANREVLEPMVVEILQARTAAEWVAIFRQAGVPCAPVRNLEEVAADPQTVHREMFPVVEHPTAGPVRVTGAPVKMGATPGAVTAAAPLPAQHTRETLGDLLGLTDAEIDDLIARKIVAQR